MIRYRCSLGYHDPVSGIHPAIVFDSSNHSIMCRCLSDADALRIAIALNQLAAREAQVIDQSSYAGVDQADWIGSHT